MREKLWLDTYNLLTNLGAQGGAISPSIYDTAQVLRLCPPVEGVRPALHWLLSQQQADGGWGDPQVPLSRDVPTLATTLTLYQYRDLIHAETAIARALVFLRRQAFYWAMADVDDLLVGSELIIPMLIQEAEACGLQVPQNHFGLLIRMGNHKRAQIAQYGFQAGSPPVHSWEAWGTTADASVIDAHGSVGSSPAATAAWLRAAQGQPHLKPLIEAAKTYLRCASAAVGTGIPGCVPFAWPIADFERAFALYAFYAADLLNQPAMQSALAGPLHALKESIGPGGVGFNGNFIADGDDTAAAVAVLGATGQGNQAAVLHQFQEGPYFKSYATELNSSLSVTARALHALNGLGEWLPDTEHFLATCQERDGRWVGDKWHSSWVYLTSHILMALADSPYTDTLLAGRDALLANQKRDGGFGLDNTSTTADTAYSVLALNALAKRDLLNADAQRAMWRAYNWLAAHYQADVTGPERIWFGKELYAPQRIDRAYELAALLAPVDIPVSAHATV